MLNLKYDCSQPVFYLGSAFMSLAAFTVYLSKLQQTGKISTLHMLLMLVIYALVVYVVSRVINWCCNKGYNNAAWVLAVLPVISILFTAFDN
jgi:hypothetical protein